MITITPYRFKCDRYVPLPPLAFDSALDAVMKLVELSKELSQKLGERHHQFALACAVIDVGDCDLTQRTLLPKPLELYQAVGFTAVAHVSWEIDLPRGNFLTAEGVLRWMAKENNPASFAETNADSSNNLFIGYSLEAITFKDGEKA